MEKSRLILVLAMLLASLNIQAGWRVVIDKRTTAAVAANAASQRLIEDRHNGCLYFINARQEHHHELKGVSKIFMRKRNAKYKNIYKYAVNILFSVYLHSIYYNLKNTIWQNGILVFIPCNLSMAKLYYP